MKKIYFDYAATTPLDPRVMAALRPYLAKEFGNASSLHSFGLVAERAVTAAKKTVADFLCCNEEEIFFTSGATESNNLALFGLVKALKAKKTKGKIHLITSQIEHDAILEPCQALQAEGVAVTYLPVDKNGLVSLNALKKAVRRETALISIMYVNNEIGTIEPIKEIGLWLQEENKRRLAQGQNRIYFHTDATQAVNYGDCHVDYLGVDLLSLSAHKIYGPKGVGLLYARRSTPLQPLFFGGHQQQGIRSGTYNVPGIVGLAAALKIIANKKNHAEEKRRVQQFKDYLIKALKEKIKDIIVTVDKKYQIPTVAHFIFPSAEGESILLMLSQLGIAVSTGSACSSGSLDPSHVLLAIGIKPELAHGSVRVTLGRMSSLAEVKYLVKVLPPIIKKLRAMSPLK